MFGPYNLRCSQTLHTGRQTACNSEAVRFAFVDVLLRVACAKHNLPPLSSDSPYVLACCLVARVLSRAVLYGRHG